MNGKRLVQLAADLKPTGLMRDMQLRALPASGLDMQEQRSHVAGGTIELRITPTPDTDDPGFPRRTFPKGTFMVAVIEGWPNGHNEFLWTGPRGYESAIHASAAGLPHFERIVRQRKA